MSSYTYLKDKSAECILYGDNQACRISYTGKTLTVEWGNILTDFEENLDENNNSCLEYRPVAYPLSWINPCPSLEVSSIADNIENDSEGFLWGAKVIGVNDDSVYLILIIEINKKKLYVSKMIVSRKGYALEDINVLWPSTTARENRMSLSKLVDASLQVLERDNASAVRMLVVALDSDGRLGVVLLKVNCDSKIEDMGFCVTDLIIKDRVTATNYRCQTVSLGDMFGTP